MRHFQKDIPAVTKNAINRTLTQVKKTATDQIAGETGLKKTTIRGKLLQRRASNKRLSGMVDATPGRAYNLITQVSKSDRNPKVIRRQGGVASSAWGKKRIYKKTFIVPTRKGDVVATRSRSQGGLKWVYGSSIRGEFRRDRTLNKLKATANRFFMPELHSQARKRIAKIKWLS